MFLIVNDSSVHIIPKGKKCHSTWPKYNILFSLSNDFPHFSTTWFILISNVHFSASNQFLMDTIKSHPTPFLNEYPVSHRNASYYESNINYMTDISEIAILQHKKQKQQSWFSHALAEARQCARLLLVASMSEPALDGPHVPVQLLGQTL